MSSFRPRIYWLFLVLPFSAFAHGYDPVVKMQTTYLSAFILTSLWLAYSIGALRIKTKWRHFFAYQSATVIALFTIFGRLDKWAEISTAAHMSQHMLMMTVIAPLWVIAKPLPQWRSVLGNIIVYIWQPALRIAHYPVLAALLHAACIWIWHAPKLYAQVLVNPWMHVLQHSAFLFSAGIFWWSVLRSNYHAAPRAFMGLLFTLMHTGFLGALLTFANLPLFKTNGTLASQQLAGLIMWVLGSFPYFVASIWCGVRWLPQVWRQQRL